MAEVSVTDKGIEVAVDAAEQLIFAKIKQIGEIKNQQKKTKEMLQTFFDADEDWKAAQEVLTNAQNEKKGQEDRIVQNNSEAMKINTKLKDIKDDLKLLNEDLNERLLAYTLATGKDFLETIDGTRVTIIRTAKISSQQLSLF